MFSNDNVFIILCFIAKLRTVQHSSSPDSEFLSVSISRKGLSGECGQILFFVCMLPISLLETETKTCAPVCL